MSRNQVRHSNLPNFNWERIIQSKHTMSRNQVRHSNLPNFQYSRKIDTRVMHIKYDNYRGILIFTQAGIYLQVRSGICTCIVDQAACTG